MSRTAVTIILDVSEQELLQKIHRKRSTPVFQKERLQIVLAAASGLRTKDIAAAYHLERHRVGTWRNRWATQHKQWKESDASLRPPLTEKLVLQWLADQPGRGRKEDFTADQRTKIAALSLETPAQYGFPVTHWSAERLAKAAVKRGIVATISGRTVNRILKKTTYRRTGVGIGSTPK
jgi:putative transposase